jgi:uncharacterized RDD family membrane protein YckC
VSSIKKSLNLVWAKRYYRKDRLFRRQENHLKFTSTTNKNYMNNYKCPQCGLVNWIKVEFCKRCNLPNQYAQFSPSQPMAQNTAFAQTSSMSAQTMQTSYAAYNTLPQSNLNIAQQNSYLAENNYSYPQNFQSEINTVCGMCETQSNSMKELYEDDVCKNCHRQYISRRQAAFLLDLIIYRGLATFAIIWTAASISESLILFAALLSFVPILLKDGTKGVSIGKLIAGLRTVDFTTKQSCGIGKSILRNIILYIPFMLLIELVFIQNGKRLGDRIVNTRVVWNKYEKARVFWK